MFLYFYLILLWIYQKKGTHVCMHSQNITQAVVCGSIAHSTSLQMYTLGPAATNQPIIQNGKKNVNGKKAKWFLHGFELAITEEGVPSFALHDLFYCLRPSFLLSYSTHCSVFRSMFRLGASCAAVQWSWSVVVRACYIANMLSSSHHLVRAA